MTTPDELEALHRERFGPPPPTVGELRARQAELADLQYRDPNIVRAYVQRIGGRICDVPAERLDIITTCFPRPTIEDLRLQVG